MCVLYVCVCVISIKKVKKKSEKTKSRSPFPSRILGFFSLFFGSSVRENADAQLLHKKINTP